MCFNIFTVLFNYISLFMWNIPSINNIHILKLPLPQYLFIMKVGINLLIYFLTRRVTEAGKFPKMLLLVNGFKQSST